jgi:tRNA-specific adenosine deaminase 3
VDAFIVTFNPIHSGAFLQFLQLQNLQALPSLKHLRRIRRTGESTAQAVVSPVLDISLDALTESLSSSSAFKDLPIPTLSILEVPANPARTPAQAKEWSQAYWPVVHTPIKEDVLAKNRAESFSRGKVEWMRSMCQQVIQLSQQARKRGDHGIVCLAAESWDASVHALRGTKKNKPVILGKAFDSRKTSKNPFGHAAMNLIAQVAELDTTDKRPHLPSSEAAYYLTGLTVFMTHEPCLLCSMALLHSRITTLVYVKSSPGAGGCGSEYRLHEQKGTNHRFEVYKVKPDAAWASMIERIEDVEVDP